MIPAPEALQRLRDGNRRFVSNVRSHESLASEARRAEVAAGQEPFAIILGCSDSRVPAEIVFDQGLGDLFVIRVAGNIVAPSQIGSVEFAAERYGTRLVVVLGHSQCGAILATIDELKRPTDQPVAQPAFDRRPRAARRSSRCCERDCTAIPTRSCATPCARTSASRQAIFAMARTCSSS